MDCFKYQPFPKKPSRVLGFLLAGVFTVLAVFAAWEHTGRLFWWDVPPVGLERAQWVVLLSAVAAVAGWIFSAMVTIRNSIKQHTINTLLQSRLSATYMENARAVSLRYFGISGKLHLLTTEEINTPQPEYKLQELGYLLNYLEFIAAAIRFGDLDEKLMRMTLRGMVCNTYEVAKVLIESNRTSMPTTPGKPPAPSKTFEHLAWLYRFWFDAGLQHGSTLRPAPPAASSLTPTESPALQSARASGPSRPAPGP